MIFLERHNYDFTIEDEYKPVILEWLIGAMVEIEDGQPIKEQALFRIPIWPGFSS
jgi:hypothetical protein